MKFKETLVSLVLIGGIVAVFAGLALVSRGESYGWLAVVLAAPLLFVAQRSMRASAEG